MPERVEMRPRAVILLGEPGAGKGTQAREVSHELGVPHISTGDMLRDAVKKRTPEGLRAQSVIDQGQLVPDEIVCSIVEARVQAPDCRDGFILDGFPRTLRQAKFLDHLLEADGRWCPLVLNMLGVWGDLQRLLQASKEGGNLRPGRWRADPPVG